MADGTNRSEPAQCDNSSMSASAGERETPAWASCFPVAALLAWAFLRIGTWFGRDYTHDDFYFAYLSWLRAIRARPGVDTDALVYTPLVELFAPAFRAWPESFLPLDLARAFILVVGLGLLGMVYVLSRKLGASVPWALGAVSLVAWQGDFLLRISDVRTDAIATLLLLASLLLVLRADGSRLGAAGLCFATAVFFSVKLATAVPALTLALFLTSGKRMRPALLRFAAGGIIGTLFWQGFRALSDGWRPIVTGFKALAGSSAEFSTGSSGELFQRAMQIAPVSSILLFVGALGTVGAPLLRWGGRHPLPAPHTRRLVYASFAVLFVAVFLRADPYLFSYNFVILMAILGPLVAGLPGLLPSHSSPGARVLLLALAVAVPVSEGAGVLSATLGRTNAAQRRVVKWIWDATDPQERVFDWQGMHWGRRGVYHWWMFSGWLPAYKGRTLYSVADELKASQVTLVIDNYRLGWLHRSDREFFQSHYVRIDSCLFAPGREFSLQDARDGADFDIVSPGFYRVDPHEAAAGVLIDGAPAGVVQRLGAGPHRLSPAPGGSPGGMRLLFTTPRRERFALPCPTPETLYYGFAVAATGRPR